MAYAIPEMHTSIDVAFVCELENQSDVWRSQGHQPDLLCVVLTNSGVLIYDRYTGDLLKEHKEIPQPFQQ